MRISDWSSDVCSSDLIEPTLFADVKPDDTIAQEEIFGPVLAVIPYDSEEEALEIANNSIYGLSAQVAAATNEEAYEFAKKIRTGTVSINNRSEEHTSELQSLMRNSYAVLCLKKKNIIHKYTHT